MGSSHSSNASNVETLTSQLETLITLLESSLTRAQPLSPNPNVPDESPEPESREEEPKPKEEENADRSPEEVEESEKEKGDAFPYTLRPAEHDCAYYVRTGVCRYGLNCKFNHPPDRMKAKYYMTPGGCKYGNGCNYVHQEKNEVVELNFLGLPLRPGRKECMYYMRTGACKYSTNCWYHHPDPTAVGRQDSLSAYQNGGSPQQHALPAQMPMTSWPSQGTPNEPITCLGAPQSFVPGYYSPPHPNQWNGYQVPVNPSYPTGMHVQHPSLASNMKDASRVASDAAPRKVQTGEYPERPGQPECHFFVKTGVCKFKGACKFHHPKSRFPKTPRVVLNTVGLPPLRPDQTVCTHYSRHGICKYGQSCRYNHPTAAVAPTTSSRSDSQDGSVQPRSEVRTGSSSNYPNQESEW
ncbi:zinc finger CCCH domain-containing protein 65-like [Iris pallida]|uniref:Zinc finger CCCH domain-containing protein 65-like n=1 Tax=Iris pallida TaxID=29817 RepID=A0AAX6DMG8_IRIPA|nr:zinc finger CCCH domain-containing protein 65-like [Iris pallida]KAJ6801836.1 zinc finger CCCH domain-containing protein 65-like [Iris pallida]